MTLTLKYEQKGFFGGFIYTEETKENATKQDFLKAMRHMKKNFDTALEIDNIVCFWDSTQNFEYETVTVHAYDNANSRREYIQDFNCFKKEWANKFAE